MINSKYNPLIKCSCRLCRAGSRTVFGRHCHHAAASKLRHAWTLIARRIITGSDPDELDTLPVVSIGYTD